jgi:hypothetical protein
MEQDLCREKMAATKMEYYVTQMQYLLYQWICRTKEKMARSEMEQDLDHEKMAEARIK